MWAYILRRIGLMLPTLVGVVTITFVITEFVPGGPVDQIQAQLEGQAGRDGGGEVSAGGGERTARGRPGAHDPREEMRLRRVYGLHHGPLARYLRTLLWFGRDGLLSSLEIADNTAEKVVRSRQNYLVVRRDNAYHAYRNRWAPPGAEPGELVYDPAAGVLRSVVDGTTFDVATGRPTAAFAAAAALDPVPLEVRSLTQRVARKEGGRRATVLQTRDEVYLRETLRAALANGDNWHGFFLLKFGSSINKNKSVLVLIRERLPVSMRLGVVSFFLTYTVCLLLGIAKAVRNGTPFDAATSAAILLGYSIPGFVLAVLLLVLFGPGEAALIKGALPLAGINSAADPAYATWTAWQRFTDNVHHLVAPILCLSIGSFAVLTMLTKNSILEELHQLYAVAARARGLSARTVLYKHVLRNALIPLVTGFPSSFLAMFFTGSLLIERIFSLNGLGLLSYESVMERDFPVIMGNLFIFTILGLAGRLLTDIAYVIVDPRITFDAGKA